MFEKPTFALWRRTHVKIATKKPTEFKAKYDSRKPYNWTVLTYLQYDPALVGSIQPTWFMAKGGQPTAWGRILSHWIKGPRECFLIEAWNRRTSDTYIVVFSKTGTFITAFSTTRTDVPAPIFPLAPKRARTLLKLNGVTPDSSLREISEEAVLRIISKNPIRLKRARDRVWNTYIPVAESLKLVCRDGDTWRFIYGVQETSRLIQLLCPVVI